MFGTLVPSPTDFKVQVKPRIHLGLISMHSDALRKNGGIGFSIEGPIAQIDLTVSNRTRIHDERPYPLSASELEQLCEAIQFTSLSELFDVNALIRITGDLRTHTGMGSGTALRLGVLEGLYNLNGKDAQSLQLIRSSGRGGTSGIGINTYFSGGMILDLGVRSTNTHFAPSSQRSPLKPPLSLPPISMPNWPLCLCLPRSIVPKSQEQEVEFFSRVTPLSPAASYRAAYEALFNVYASVADNDYISFSKAVESMQQTEWKSLEWREYGSTLELLKNELFKLGADCVGMSSLGPMLFSFGSVTALEKIEAAQNELDCDVIITVPSNKGRLVL